MSDDLRLKQIALARQALLCDGADLTDMLASAWYDRTWIIQSWRRCLEQGALPQEEVVFEQVSPHARSRAIDEHASLLVAARPELERLAATIAPIRYFALLTDARGMVIDTAGAIDRRNRPTQAIARVGVDLSERSIGTSAIGAALTELAPVWLHRGEHFFQNNSVYSCAGAPLFGPDGACVGMLDVTGVEVPERPELRHLVAQSARAIEDALVLSLPHSLRLYLSWPATWRTSGGAVEGALVCLDEDGSVVGANHAAREMLPGLRAAPRGLPHASELFALPWATLFDLAHEGRACTVPLWSGLRLCASAQFNAEGPHAASPATGQGAMRPLREVETDLIRQAVRDAGGRVAEAAKALGLSRATVYRHLAAVRHGER
ncbi:MAG: histidine kinase [Comamonadaceae bacterium]|nr:histidine kinase [Burkholderiales bacterium]MEB2347930.1 histidine kinase [Comamonadaceae bacterium]